MKSTRRQRFENVAAKRTQKIMDSIESLSNCSNRTNYEYAEADVKKMFKALRESINNCEAMFQNELNKRSKTTFKF